METNPATTANRIAPLVGEPLDPMTRQAPQNLDAEQALLGCLLVDNEVLHRVSHLVSKDDFYEDIHGALYQLIVDTAAAGKVASLITLKPVVDDWGDVGGKPFLKYMVGLWNSAAAMADAPDYARQIRELAIRRLAIVALEGRIRQLYQEDLHKSPEPIFSGIQTDIDAVRDPGRGGDTRILDTAQVVEASLAATQRAYEAGGGLVGLSTGIRALDEKLGGMDEGNLFYLGGRTSMGKTALATTIAFNVMQQGKKVGFISLEMTAAQLGARILAKKSAVDIGRQRRGLLSEADWHKLDESRHVITRDLRQALRLTDTGGMTAERISHVARYLRRKDQIDLLIVDYLGLIRTDGHGPKHSTKATEISAISQGLKLLAMSLGIPVLCLLQLNRQIDQNDRRDDKRPRLSDLKDSGSLEQDADVVMFVHREQYDVERREPDTSDVAAHSQWRADLAAVEGKAEVIIGKHRHDRPGKVDLYYDAPRTLFRDLSEVR